MIPKNPKKTKKKKKIYKNSRLELLIVLNPIPNKMSHQLDYTITFQIKIACVLTKRKLNYI